MRVLVPAAVLGFCIAFLAWLDHPIVRYNHVGTTEGCAVPQLLNLPQQVDFVSLGSSRMREGVDPMAMMTHSGGVLQSAYNLARSGRDIMRSYAILRDLDERGIHPKVVLVEINLEALRGVEKRDDFQGRSQYAGFMRYSDILELADALPADHLFASGLIFGFLKGKLEYGLIRHLTGSVTTGIQSLAEPPAMVCRKDILSPPLEMKKSKIEKFRRLKRAELEGHKQEKLKKLLKTFGDLAHAEDNRFAYTPSSVNQVELYYLDRIRKLAARNGMKLLVSRQWGYADPPLSDDVLNRIRSLVPEFIYPSGSLVRDSAQDFVDEKHMGPRVREAYSRWLAEVVVEGGA